MRELEKSILTCRYVRVTNKTFTHHEIAVTKGFPKLLNKYADPKEILIQI